MLDLTELQLRKLIREEFAAALRETRAVARETDSLMTVSEVCALLSVKRDKLRNIHELVPAVKGHKNVRYLRSEIMAYIERLKTNKPLP